MRLESPLSCRIFAKLRSYTRTCDDAIQKQHIQKDVVEAIKDAANISADAITLLMRTKPVQRQRYTTVVTMAGAVSPCSPKTPSHVMPEDSRRHKLKGVNLSDVKKPSILRNHFHNNL